MANKIRGHGEGSIHRRASGSWRAQMFQEGVRLGKTFKRKRDAQDWLREMQEELEMGLDAERGKITVEMYLGQWLEMRRVSLRQSTVDQYEQITRDHILPRFGETSLKDLRLSGLERFYSDLLRSGVSKRTVRLVHAVLHAALEKALKYRYLTHNPAHGAALPRYAHSEMHVLDEDQVTHLLIAARGSRHETLYYLAVQTGMRLGELFGLVWSDVDWATSELSVKRQVKRQSGGGWAFASTKTARGTRKIKLGSEILKRLKSHELQVKLTRELAGSGWKENDLIFPSLVGTPIGQSNLRKDFFRVLDRARLPRIRFHDLRHTAASLMLNNGVPLIAVSNILGHSRPSTTLDIYAHLYQDVQSDAARIMDTLITPVSIEVPDLEESTASWQETEG